MKNARILLAEDEAIVGIEIKNSLQRLGYTHTDLESITQSVIEDSGGQDLDRGNLFLDWVRWLEGTGVPVPAFAGS